MNLGTLQDVIQDMKNGTTDFTVNGECSNCGECCADLLPISDKEVERIREHIQKHGIKEQVHFPLAATTFDLTCPFRSNLKRKCLIYQVRPEICRDFKCDKARKGIWADMGKYDRDMRVRSMRQTFFGGER